MSAHRIYADLALATGSLHDGKYFYFGSGTSPNQGDFKVGFDGTQLEFLPLVDDTGTFAIGDGTTDCDFKWFGGAVTTYALFDRTAAAQQVEFRNVPIVARSTASATPVTALQYGTQGVEGVRIRVIDETVTLTAAVKTDLTTQLPATSVVLAVQGNLQTTVVGDGTGDNGLTKIGIGTAADPDIYGLSADLVKNTKITGVPAAYAVIAAATTWSVYAVDNAGAAVTEKFVAGSTVRVRIVYMDLDPLVDAA